MGPASSGLTATFSKQIRDATGAVDEKYSTYIRASGEGVEIGKSNSPFVCRLDNTKLSFVQKTNGVENEVAYMSNNKLYITNAQILNELAIGQGDGNLWKWIKTSNGLALKYVS